MLKASTLYTQMSNVKTSIIIISNNFVIIHNCWKHIIKIFYLKLVTQATNRYTFSIMLYFMTQFFVDIHIFDDDSHIAQRNFHKLIYVAQSIFFSSTSQTSRVLTYFHKLCDLQSLAIWIFNMSIDLQIVLDAFSHHSNDIDVLNIEYSFNLFVVINSLSELRILNKLIATINISLDRMKTLIVMIIARNNSIKNDIALYSKTTKCLNDLTKRLKIDIQMNVEKTSIVKKCFKTWKL